MHITTLDCCLMQAWGAGAASNHQLVQLELGDQELLHAVVVKPCPTMWSGQQLLFHASRDLADLEKKKQ